MSPIAVASGLALGLGALLAARGLWQLTDKALDEAARRKGYWPLNAGLVLIAGSVIVFTRFSGG